MALYQQHHHQHVRHSLRLYVDVTQATRCMFLVGLSNGRDMSTAVEPKSASYQVRAQTCRKQAHDRRRRRTEAVQQQYHSTMPAAYRTAGLQL